MLVSHVLVPPAIARHPAGAGNRVQGFLGPGHVCAVMGYREYEALAARYRVPIVVTGFEPVDLLEGVLMAVRQLEAGRAEVENQYARAVAREGNPAARALIDEVFEVVDRKWRGVGTIPKSGYRLRAEYRAHDAERLFEVGDDRHRRVAAVHQRPGPARPEEAARLPGVRQGVHARRRRSGATMVSAEGACAAYYQYGRHLRAGTSAAREATAILPQGARERRACKLRVLRGARRARSRRCARALAERFRPAAGCWSWATAARACDAAARGRRVPCTRSSRSAAPCRRMALATDTALLTAVGNDSDFARAFVDQLELLARPRGRGRWASPPRAPRPT